MLKQVRNISCLKITVPAGATAGTNIYLPENVSMRGKRVSRIVFVANDNQVDIQTSMPLVGRPFFKNLNLVLVQFGSSVESIKMPSLNFQPEAKFQSVEIDYAVDFRKSYIVLNAAAGTKDTVLLMYVFYECTNTPYQEFYGNLSITLPANYNGKLFPFIKNDSYQYLKFVDAVKNDSDYFYLTLKDKEGREWDNMHSDLFSQIKKTFIFDKLVLNWNESYIMCDSDSEITLNFYF